MSELNVSNRQHPHHEVWREHVQSVLDGSPKTVECSMGDEYDWSAFDGETTYGVCSAGWLVGLKYRIARPMVTRTITYPAPMTKAPAYGTKYWCIFPNNKVSEVKWTLDAFDLTVLETGAAFHTEADAKAADAAIFCKQQ